MINNCRNILAGFPSAIMFSFQTLNDLTIFDENLPACQPEFYLRDIPLHI